jgi:uncharacterized membrane protein
VSKRKWLRRQQELERQRQQGQKPDQVQAAQTRAFVMQWKGEMFAGPLPHPTILAEYDKILHGAANRIITMAENQQGHRHHLEKTVIEGNVRAAKRGQIFAFVLGTLGIVIGGSLIALGKDIQGFIGVRLAASI